MRRLCGLNDVAHMKLPAVYAPDVCLPRLREVGWTLVEESRVRIQCPIASWEANLPLAGKEGSTAEGKRDWALAPFLLPTDPCHLGQVTTPLWAPVLH